MCLGVGFIIGRIRVCFDLVSWAFGRGNWCHRSGLDLRGFWANDVPRNEDSTSEFQANLAN